MNALTFDTLKAARRLRDEFGFDERQATGIVETFADGMSLSLDALATRQDLAGFATTAQLHALEESVKAALQEAWRQRSELQNDTEAAIAAARNDTEAAIIAARSDTQAAIAALRSETLAKFTSVHNDINAEFVSVRNDMTAEFASVRNDMTTQFASVRAEIAALRAETRADTALLRADMAAQENRMTIKLGAMIAAAAGFLVVVDKLL